MADSRAQDPGGTQFSWSQATNPPISPEYQQHVPPNKKRKNDYLPHSFMSENYYNALAGDSEMPDASHNASRSNVPPVERKRRLPPFTIVNLDLSTVKKLISNISTDKKDIHMILTNRGIEVVMYDADHYRKLREMCKSTKIEYFDHPLEDEQSKHFVMYGLHKTTPMSEITESFKEYNLVPMKIIPLSKDPRTDGQVTYRLVYKSTDKITLEHLEQIVAIGYLRVRFKHYRGNKYPTQCPNCLHFGHGSDYCNRRPRCIRCGENHKSSECDKLTDKNDPKAKIPAEKVRCANCQGTHTANFKECPKNPLVIREQKRLMKEFNVQPSPPKPVINSQRDFPSLPKQARTPHSQPNPHHGPSWSQIANNNNSRNEKLLSNDEMLDLVFNLHQQIRTCRTRSDQIMTIMRFAISLLNHDSP